MKPFVRLLLVVAFLAMPAVYSGCSKNAGGAPAVKLTPEQKFQRVVDLFRAKVENQQIGFVVNTGTSRSTLIGKNVVSSELIPPATAADHFRAIITVESESYFSVRKTKSAEDIEAEQQKAKDRKDQSQSSLVDPKKKEDINILPQDLAAKTGNDTSSSPTSPKPKQPSEESVASHPDKRTRKYELIYTNERWSLVTKPDPKNEKSIQYAFDEALDQ